MYKQNKKCTGIKNTPSEFSTFTLFRDLSHPIQSAKNLQKHLFSFFRYTFYMAKNDNNTCKYPMQN